MLNLFQHPDLSTSYETLKQVQGDKFGFVQQALQTINIITNYES